MLKIKMNKFLKELGVKFIEEREEFIITAPKIDNVRSVIDYNSFPDVKYDYNTGELYVEVNNFDEFDEVLIEIKNFVDNERQKIKKVNKKLEEAKDE